jgi:drug/metabolite transporter (DMT)-like permease
LKLKEWVAFIALGLIWGSSFLWIKIAVSEVGPFLLVAIRLLIGILGLLVVVIARRPAWPLQKQTWINLTLLGITNNGLPYLLISWGEQYIDSAVAAILNSTVPLFTMLIAHFALSDDRLTPSRLVALLTGFSGVVILVSRDLNGTLQSGVFGQIAVIIGAISYAFSTILARRTTQKIDPILRAMIPLFGADLILWGVTPIAEAPLQFPKIPLTWVAIVWLGLMGVAVAYMLYFYLIHSVGPTRTSLVTYIFPLVGVVLGVLFLKETLDWHLALGTVFIVGSLILVNRKA